MVYSAVSMIKSAILSVFPEEEAAESPYSKEQAAVSSSKAAAQTETALPRGPIPDLCSLLLFPFGMPDTCSYETGKEGVRFNRG